MRLFVAIDVPAEIEERLETLCTGLKGARWIGTDRMHLTLRFLGELNTGQANDAAERLGEVRAPAFDLSLAGIGAFGAGRRLRALWVGAEASPTLGQLQAKVEGAARKAGLQLEARRFHPHVTLARFRGVRTDLAGYLSRHEPFRAGPFRVEEFVLYSSRLAEEGPAYRVEARYPLAAQPVRGAPQAPRGLVEPGGVEPPTS